MCGWLVFVLFVVLFVVLRDGGLYGWICNFVMGRTEGGMSWGFVGGGRKGGEGLVMFLMERNVWFVGLWFCYCVGKLESWKVG